MSVEPIKRNMINPSDNSWSFAAMKAKKKPHVSILEKKKIIISVFLFVRNTVKMTPSIKNSVSFSLIIFHGI